MSLNQRLDVHLLNQEIEQYASTLIFIRDSVSHSSALENVTDYINQRMDVLIAKKERITNPSLWRRLVTLSF